MAESEKIKEYRKNLQDSAKSKRGDERREAEGNAAKIGNEIYGEERKGKPEVKPGGKPRR